MRLDGILLRVFGREQEVSVETCCPLQSQPLGAPGAQLCQVTARFLVSQHVALPPGPDIGCYQDPQGTVLGFASPSRALLFLHFQPKSHTGKDVCDEDLSPQTLATRFANSDPGDKRKLASAREQVVR